MATRRYPRHRKSSKSGRKRRRKQASPAETRRVKRSPYGDIPLVKLTDVAADGRSYDWWSPDPDYRPPMPRGAVRGDVRKQVFCPACHDPKYFYVDERRECVQCGEPFTFAASEQKYWYETLKFNFYSAAIRCIECRRRRRTARALHRAVADARNDLVSSPDDPARQLALARAIVRLHERLSVGNLEDAIAAARRAAALWPQSPEPSFWEGMAHVLAGRARKGRGCLTAFLERAKSSRTTAGLVSEARRELGRTG